MYRRNTDPGRLKVSVLRTAPATRRTPWSALHYLVYLGACSLAIAYWVVLIEPNWASQPNHGANIEENHSAKTGALTLTPSQEKVLTIAREQVNNAVRFSDGYYAIPYPGGDVPNGIGVSADIVVRSMRGANIDLQAEIHKDILKHPKRYPLKRWKMSRPDTNVDHRRLVNLYIYLQHNAHSLSVQTEGPDLVTYQAGDIVMWRTKDGMYPDHVGVVSNRLDENGIPYVIDLHPQMGRALESHKVNSWVVRGHFRLLPSHGSSTASLSS